VVCILELCTDTTVLPPAMEPPCTPCTFVCQDQVCTVVCILELCTDTTVLPPAMEPPCTPCTRRGPDDASEQLAALPDWVSQASTPQVMPNGAGAPATPRVTQDRRFVVERRPLDTWCGFPKVWNFECLSKVYLWHLILISIIFSWYLRIPVVNRSFFKVLDLMKGTLQAAETFVG